MQYTYPVEMLTIPKLQEIKSKKKTYYFTHSEITGIIVMSGIRSMIYFKKGSVIFRVNDF